MPTPAQLSHVSLAGDRQAAAGNQRPREAGRACPMRLWALDPRSWHAVLFQSPFLRATQRREARHTGSRLFQQAEQSCNTSSGCMAAAVCWLLPPAGQQVVAGDGGGAGGGLCRQTACHPTSNLNALPHTPRPCHSLEATVAAACFETWICHQRRTWLWVAVLMTCCCCPQAGKPQEVPAAEQAAGLLSAERYVTTLPQDEHPA